MGGGIKAFIASNEQHDHARTVLVYVRVFISSFFHLPSLIDCCAQLWLVGDAVADLLIAGTMTHLVCMIASIWPWACAEFFAVNTGVRASNSGHHSWGCAPYHRNQYIFWCGDLFPLMDLFIIIRSIYRDHWTGPIRWHACECPTPF
jgi:hypothetical protein